MRDEWTLNIRQDGEVRGAGNPNEAEAGNYYSDNEYVTVVRKSRIEEADRKRLREVAKEAYDLLKLLGSPDNRTEEEKQEDGPFTKTGEEVCGVIQKVAKPIADALRTALVESRKLDKE